MDFSPKPATKIFRCFRFACAAAAMVFSFTLALADPARWRQEIGQLTQADVTNPPARGGVVFVGSSSIRLWTTLQQDFPGLNVSNRGFGGSNLGDSVFYLDRLVLPHEPRVVVLYAGENDLAGGMAPEKVAADFDRFRERIHAALPETRIIFLSCKPSPSRRRHLEKFQRANALISAACARDPRCTFVDVYAAMLGADGQPRPDIFVGDRLHMNGAGYAIWVRLLMPVLRDQWAAAGQSRPTGSP